jgi:hypothetical protein
MKFKSTLTDTNRKAFAIDPRNSHRLTHFGKTSFEYNSVRKAIIACTLYRPKLGHQREGNFILSVRQNANHKYEIGQKKGRLICNVSFTPKRVVGNIDRGAS